MFREWMSLSACASPAASARMLASGSGPYSETSWASVGPGMYSVASQGLRREGAADPLCRLRFALEPLPEGGVPGVLGVHDLDGDLAAVRGDPQVNPAHPAVPEQPDELVTAEALRVARAQRQYRRLAHAPSGFPKARTGALGGPRTAV
jgi:hypothetical protein